MIKYSIDLTSEKIEKFVSLNDEIIKTLDDLAGLYRLLDKEVWQNKEKEKLDSILLPFFENTRNNLINGFDKSINVLSSANKIYKEEFDGIKRMVGSLNGKIL